MLSEIVAAAFDAVPRSEWAGAPLRFVVRSDLIPPLVEEGDPVVEAYLSGEDIPTLMVAYDIKNYSSLYIRLAKAGITPQRRKRRGGAA